MRALHPRWRQLLDSAPAPSPRLTLYLPPDSEGRREALFRGLLNTARSLIPSQGPMTKLPLERVWLDSRDSLPKDRSLAMFSGPEGLQIVTMDKTVSPRVVVADSYHVKPLLSWIFHRPEALVFHLGPTHLDVHRFCKGSLTALDSLPFPALLESQPKRRGGLASQRERLSDLLWSIQNHVDSGRERLEAVYFSGFESLAEVLLPSLRQNLTFTGEIALVPGMPFSHNLERLEGRLKEWLDHQRRIELAHAKQRFLAAERERRTRSSVFRIAPLALRGQIETLFVAEDECYWGEFDRQSGGVSLNHRQSGPKDDDVLDDLCEVVLAQGGEVVIAPRAQLPGQRALSAIISGDGVNLQGDPPLLAS